MSQLSAEALFLLEQIRLDSPVFPCLERLDLLLPFDDHAQGGALYTPCGETAPDLLPEQRRQLEAHQIIEGAACLLGIHQIH